MGGKSWLFVSSSHRTNEGMQQCVPQWTVKTNPALFNSIAYESRLTLKKITNRARFTHRWVSFSNRQPPFWRHQRERKDRKDQVHPSSKLTHPNLLPKKQKKTNAIWSVKVKSLKPTPPIWVHRFASGKAGPSIPENPCMIKDLWQVKLYGPRRSANANTWDNWLISSWSQAIHTN